MTFTRAGWTLLLCLSATTTAYAAPRFTAAEMMTLRRLSDVRPSADGAQVAFALTDIDLAAGTRGTDVWAVATAGGEPRRLTTDPAADTRPRFSRDGRTLAFLSTRGGSSQVWLVDARDGSAPRQLTRLSTGVDAFEWIDEARLLVASSVFPACGADDACNARRLAEASAGSSVRVYDELLFRHWDSWRDGRRTHLLALATDGRAAVDLTPGRADAPPFNLAGQDWALSPDGSEACFSRKSEKDEAWSTNAELFVVPTTGGPARAVGTSPGYDGSCRYSPDGRWLAWRAQQRNGYESDRWQLRVLDRRSGATRSLTSQLDRQVEEFTFSPDGATVYFTVEEDGHTRVHSIATAGGPIATVLDGATLAELAVLPDGKTMLASEASLTHPAEIVRLGTDGVVARVTRLNDARLERFALRGAESVRYEGAEGKQVQAWLVKPPDFDPSRSYPLLVLIHGGPQGAWTDGWTYRWNAQVLASAGFVVFMPNPRGSVGWGQAFTDDINGDWGGRAYEDVMRGTDWAEALPFVARGRTAAAGASFGGYMVNWIAGHTGRFRALVSHDGIFDTVSTYYSTEELWFPEWEFGGPPFREPGLYERWNPRNHAAKFQTPTLVVHGERDFRLPAEQGLAMFTALRRQGVPARLVVFPDENHWVLKPVNSVRWYSEVLSWLERWTAPGEAGAGR